MEKVWVICRNPHIRKFYVDNLSVRGYPARGTPSLSEEKTQPLKKYALGQSTPNLVLMWGELAVLEPDIDNIRQSYASSVPIVVVSEQTPASSWMAKWNIAAHRTSLADSRKLMNFLKLWLN